MFLIEAINLYMLLFILKELLMYPKIDYDLSSELMYKLINQAVNKFRSYLNGSQVVIVIKEKRYNRFYIYTNERTVLL